MFGKKEKKKGSYEFIVALVVLVAALHYHLLPPVHMSKLSAATAAIYVPHISDHADQYQWARALLKGMHDPRTVDSVSTIVVWEDREGGGFGNQAENNPLNVNPTSDVSWPGYEAEGAWAFPTVRDGLKYTIITLDNPCYAGIRSALKHVDDTYAIRTAIVESPWASGHYGGSL